VRTVLRLTLVVALAVVSGPLTAAASPHDRPAAGPKGAMPGELWQAIEHPRRPPRPARSASPVADVLDTPSEPAPALPVANPAGRILPTRTPAGDPVYFAGVAGLQLRLPGGVKALGFHESGARGALPMHPIGRPSHNDNMPKLREAPVTAEDGTTYAVMGGRGRGGGPTTAVDVAMAENWPLQSPVTGMVEVVQSYRLYGRMHDYFVQIIPDSRPDLRVKLLHLDTVHVAPGHRVVEGESIIAGTARQLPLSSQVDRYAGYGPHVHIEIVPG
jgi:hypothetical protein